MTGNIFPFIRDCPDSIRSVVDDRVGCRSPPGGPRTPSHLSSAARETRGGGKAVLRGCCGAPQDGGASCFEPEREPSRLDDLALLLRSITYGEMMTLGAAIADGAPITAAEELAPALYLWAIGPLP